MTTDGEDTSSGDGSSTSDVVIEKTDDNNAPDNSQAQLLQLYESGMTEARQRADRLERELAEMGRTPPTPAAPPMDNNTFWQDSAGNIARIVDEKLRAAIKPLTDFVAETRGGNKYTQIKDKLRNDPGFKDKMDQVEPYLDEIMKTTEVTEQNVNTAALSIIGAIATGKIRPEVRGTNRGAGDPPPTPQNPSTTRNDAVNMPAHLRPSGPSLQKQGNVKPERRQLTELEKRIARETRMTDDEFLNELETDGPMVINSIMPKTKEEKEAAAKSKK